MQFFPWLIGFLLLSLGVYHRDFDLIVNLGDFDGLKPSRNGDGSQNSWMRSPSVWSKSPITGFGYLPRTPSFHESHIS